jgi:hypothetical protein
MATDQRKVERMASVDDGTEYYVVSPGVPSAALPRSGRGSVGSLMIRHHHQYGWGVQVE